MYFNLLYIYLNLLQVLEFEECYKLRGVILHTRSGEGGWLITKLLVMLNPLLNFVLFSTGHYRALSWNKTLKCWILFDDDKRASIIEEVDTVLLAASIYGTMLLYEKDVDVSVERLVSIVLITFVISSWKNASSNEWYDYTCRTLRVHLLTPPPSSPSARLSLSLRVPSYFPVPLPMISFTHLNTLLAVPRCLFRPWCNRLISFYQFRDTSTPPTRNYCLSTWATVQCTHSRTLTPSVMHHTVIIIKSYQT